MMLKVFVKKGCPGCLKATELCALEGKLDVLFFDIETEEGLCEALACSVLTTPSVILEADGSEIARWSKLPSKDEVLKCAFLSKRSKE